MLHIILFISLAFLSTLNVYAKDRLELETTFIKGNKELPQILYVVPWKDIKSKQKKEQQIILFSMFGDLFDPVNPDGLDHEIVNSISAKGK